MGKARQLADAPNTGLGTALTVQDEGAALATAAQTLDFVGPGVTVTGAGLEKKTVTIPGGGAATVLVQEGDVSVVASCNTFDFAAADFDVTESPSGEANIAIATTLTGKTLSAPTISGQMTVAGADINTASAMAALAIDVTKRRNTKSISTDSTLTFSATPTAGTKFGLHIDNTDASAHTLVIPSSYSYNQQTAITSVTIRAGAKMRLEWLYDGSTYFLAEDQHIHSDATTAVAGFLSVSDKLKLDGIAAGATANATNAELRDRSTHTGSQSQSTITDLSTDLDAIGVRLDDLESVAGSSATEDLTAALLTGRIGWSLIPAANNSTVTSTGVSVSAYSGATTGGRVFAATRYGEINKSTYTSASTAGAITGVRTVGASFWRGNATGLGGFNIHWQWGPNDAVSTARVYSGLFLTSLSDLVGTTEPSDMTDFVAFAADSTDTNLQLMHNDSSGTATKVDLGSDFPKSTATHFLRSNIFAEPGASEIGYSIRRIDVDPNIIASGTITTNLPTNAATFNWHNARGNGGTASAVVAQHGGLTVGDVTAYLFGSGADDAVLLNEANLFTKAQGSESVALSLTGSTLHTGDGSTIDCALSNSFRTTMSSGATALTLGTLTSTRSGGLYDGQEVTFRFVQNATGAGTLTLPASVKGWESESLALSTTASSINFLSIRYNAANTTWYGSMRTGAA